MTGPMRPKSKEQCPDGGRHDAVGDPGTCRGHGGGFTASSLTCVVLCCGLASFASAAAVLVCLRAPAGAEGQPPRGPRPREEGEALRALLLSSERPPRGHPNDYVSAVLSSSASGSTLGETKGTPQKVEGPQPEARTSWSVVAPAMVIHFLYVFARACVDCFFVVFCAERFGLQPAALGRLMTAQAFLMFLNSTVLYKRIVRATDVLSTAAAGMAIVCLSLLGLGRAESVSALVWTMVLYAMGAPLFNPSITILLVRLVPRRRRGRVLGLDQAGCSVFRILSPALMGLLFRDSLPATFVASGAVMFVAALLATLLRSSVPAARG
ncbi:unnamed protein product [Prorocentrum cordatum]|uniref:Major facilitator superfamily (MFS) profile domain-containing protein n=1 Tax=Prorocentrum cordatum TaxID=2364126 RepID=A0ABN9XD62_9DINO|nr:unnamed protein product [Polarella glacialis]